MKSGKNHSAKSMRYQTARRFYERYGAQLIAEMEDAREDAVLIEVSYGWAHLTEFDQLGVSLR
jgi:hypothetical protein